jgi:hypothetical protein
MARFTFFSFQYGDFWGLFLSFFQKLIWTVGDTSIFKKNLKVVKNRQKKNPASRGGLKPNLATDQIGA